MVAKIKYSDLREMVPMEAVGFIKSLDKYPLSELNASDLLVSKNLQTPINDLFNYNDIYCKGIYVLFDENNNVRYVGKSKNGFYGRLMGHLYTVAKPGWGWNAILIKLAQERLKPLNRHLTNEDHEEDLKTLINYGIVLIDVENTLSDTQLGWLEKIIMKAARIEHENHMLNTRIGWLRDWEIESSVYNLIEN